MSMTQKVNYRKLMPGIQALRFLAALGVFIYHVVIYAQRSNVIPDGFAFTKYGGVGVAVFFTLSGFLMAMLSENASPTKFLFRRIVRIYPGLWLAVATAVALKLAATGTFDASFNWGAALTLFPSGPMRYPLNVEWTLVFEMFFYCLVALLCFTPPAIRKLLIAIWLVVIVLRGSPIQAGFVWELPFSQQNIPFIVGMFAWWFRHRLTMVKGPLAVSAGILLLLIAKENQGTIGWLQQHVLVSAACGIWVLCGARASLFSETGAFKTLGDWSYGIYLIHAPLLFTAFPMIGQPSYIAFWVIAVAGLAFAAGFGAVENRLHKALQLAFKSSPLALGLGSNSRS